MTLGTILLIVLILALIGAIPAWPHSRSWGYGPSGGLGLIGGHLYSTWAGNLNGGDNTRQAQDILMAPAVTGIPARRAACRATFIPCSASGIAQPTITSVTPRSSRRKRAIFLPA
jgi:hypothetical protein